MRGLINKVVTGFIELTPDRLISHYFSSVTPIFMLHRLDFEDPKKTERSRAHVKWCLAYVRKHGYQALSLSQLIDIYAQGEIPPTKSVVFTIDDGFYDHYELGGKLFSEFDIPLCCFVISDFLDKKLWPWDDQVNYILHNTSKNNLDVRLPDQRIINLKKTNGDNLGEHTAQLQNALKSMDQTELYSWLSGFYEQADVIPPDHIPEYYRPMSWADAQRFIDAGHEIAPHTRSHRILSQLSDQESNHEIEHAFNRVHEKLNSASRVFAYPTGRQVDYGEREIDCLQKLGITGAVDTLPQHASSASHGYRLPRFALPDTPFDFIQYLSFFEELKRRIQR